MRGYDNLKLRMKHSGISYRQEKINDAIRVEQHDNEHDSSYCDHFYRWINGAKPTVGLKMSPRLYNRKWSVANGHTIMMQTLISEPVSCGQTFYNQKEDKWWICTESDCIDDIHYVSKLTECNHVIKFQLDSSDIYEYRCFDQNSTQYNSGVRDNATNTILSSQHMLTLPCDEIIISLPYSKRFFISKNPKYAKHVYELTQIDSTSYIGICKLTVTQAEIGPDDNVDIGVCSYYDGSNHKDYNEKNVYTSKIVCNSEIVRTGVSNKFYAEFYTCDGLRIDTFKPRWYLNCHFEDKVEMKSEGDCLIIKIKDESVIDEKFELFLTDQDGLSSVCKVLLSVTGLFG